MKRSRAVYFILFLSAIIIGYSSRRFSYLFPGFVNTYLGDALWALMVFFLVALFFNKSSSFKVGLIALLFCYFIETTQFYHAPWIDSVRQTKLGGLILGFGFLWSDIVSYTIGVGTGVTAELIATGRKRTLN